MCPAVRDEGLIKYRLWPFRVTQQKVARSWSTQVDLMDRYPEHRFTCSSAQQYKWLEQARGYALFSLSSVLRHHI
jgi:alpha-mannosidase